MEILRVFNNNVVLAKDDNNNEVILTGRGLGFQARPGSPVDTTRVVKTFISADKQDTSRLAQMAVEVPPEIVNIVTNAMAEIGLEDKASHTPMLVMALANHLEHTLQRIKQNVPGEYLLNAEVRGLYPEEYIQGLKLLKALNRHFDGILLKEEAVAFALHFVNSGFSSSDLSFTYTMTGIIQQMLSIIQQTYGATLDQNSIHVGRFITHLRYMFLRIYQHKQLNEESSPVVTVIRQTYPEAEHCAQTLASLVALRLGTELTDDEKAYLTLHVARIAPRSHRGRKCEQK